MEIESLFLKSLSDLPAYFPLPTPSAPAVLSPRDTTQQLLRHVGLILIEEKGLEGISGIKGPTFNASVSNE